MADTIIVGSERIGLSEVAEYPTRASTFPERHAARDGHYWDEPQGRELTADKLDKKSRKIRARPESR
jgi:hypothetical protein